MKLTGLFLALCACATALVPPRRLPAARATCAAAALRSRWASSASAYQAAGVSSLKVPEVAVILAIAGFVLGPEQLTSMAKDFGKVAGELKDVPKEFASGMKESESNKAIDAPKTKVVDVDVDVEKKSEKAESK